MSSPKSVSPEKAEFNLRGYKHFVDQRNRRKQAHSGGFPEPGTICLTYTDASGKTHYARGKINVETDVAGMRLGCAQLSVNLTKSLASRNIIQQDSPMKESTHG